MESQGDRMGSVLALPWLWRQSLSWAAMGCPDVTRADLSFFQPGSKARGALLHPQVSELIWHFHGAREASACLEHQGTDGKSCRSPGRAD